MFFGAPLALLPLGCFPRPGLVPPGPSAVFEAIIPQDFGARTPGTQYAEAHGTVAASATQIYTQVTVFIGVDTGALAQLPADGSLVALTVFNRCGTGEALSIIPDDGGEIESVGIDAAVAIADGGNATFTCLDPALQIGRQWWIT